MPTGSALPQLYSCGHALVRDDNRVGLLRDSSDAANDFVRRASEPRDERWIGANPPGHIVAGKRGRIC